MQKKMIIITECRECKQCHWVGGKPRCYHPAVPLIEATNENDYNIHQRCFTDGTKPFLDDCPWQDYNLVS
jgi:hypothetical protein